MLREWVILPIRTHSRPVFGFIIINHLNITLVLGIYTMCSVTRWCCILPMIFRYYTKMGKEWVHLMAVYHLVFKVYTPLIRHYCLPALYITYVLKVYTPYSSQCGVQQYIKAISRVMNPHVKAVQPARYFVLYFSVEPMVFSTVCTYLCW